MRLLSYFFLFVLLAMPVHADERFLDIQKVTSESGITAWLVEDHSLPIIALSLSFKGAGSINDPVDKQGRSKLLSNMLDEGAGDLDSQSFQKELSNHSISLGFSNGRDHLSGNLKTISRYKDKAFSLLKLALTEPRFDSEPLVRMKQANISRIRSSLTDPNWIAARIQNDLIYHGHPYALNSGGTITSLESLTANDLKTFKDRYLTKDRLVIGVMGDITKEELKTRLDEVFGSLPEKTKTILNENKPTHKAGTFSYKKDIPQTVINVSVPAFDHTDPDFYSARVFNYILGGGGFGSRLMEQAREKEGLTYGIYSSLSFLDKAQKFYISTSTQTDKTSRMLDIINQEVNSIKTAAVSDQELQNAKDYITGSLPLSLTSTSKIAGLLMNLQLNDRSIDYLDQYKSNIMKITKEDIQRVAKRILDTEKMNIVLVGQPYKTEDTIEINELPHVK